MEADKIKRHQKLESICESVPKLSDKYVASLLNREIHSKKRMVEEKGVFAFMEQERKPKDVNKLYLVNTIRRVEGHNRRQEVEKCYTQERLRRDHGDSESERFSRRRERRHEGTRRKRVRSREREEGNRALQSKDSDDNLREYWAKKKAEKRLAIESRVGPALSTLPVSHAPDFDSGESVCGSDAENDIRSQKRRKRDSSKKNKKILKKKKSKSKEA